MLFQSMDSKYIELHSKCNIYACMIKLKKFKFLFEFKHGLQSEKK